MEKCTSPSYEADMCVHFYVLFRLAGGRWSLQAKWWNICRETQNTSCFEPGSLCRRLPERETSSARLSWKTDRNTRKRERPGTQRVIHFHYPDVMHCYKNKQRIHENIRSVWFCLREGATCDGHPCVSVAAEQFTFMLHQVPPKLSENMTLPFLDMIAAF